MECGGPRDSEGDREVQHAGPAGRGVLAEFPAAMPPAAERVAGGPRGGARILKDCRSRWHDCAHTPHWEEDYVPHKEWFLHMDYDKVKNLTPLSCCFPWAPQPTNVKARAAAFIACRSRSPRGGSPVRSPSSLAPTPTVVPSMEQETPTLQPEEPTFTQLPVEECKQEPASPTPFLPMPKSAAATQGARRSSGLVQLFANVAG